jgi:hypothetical protein
MRRDGVFVCLIFLTVLVSSGFVCAEGRIVDLKLDDDDYRVELKFMETSSGSLDVNGEVVFVGDPQYSSPYTIRSLGSLNSEFQYILRDYLYSDKVGGKNQIEMTLLFEKTLTEEYPFVNITIDGKLYQVEMTFIDDDRVNLKVNDESRYLYKNSDLQSSSPYTISSSFSSMPEFKYILKGYYWHPLVGEIGNVTLLMGFDVNLTDMCLENWSCEDWGECLDDEQNRLCTDINSCGTVENKPSEIQSCSSPDSDIECYLDDDCSIEGTGSPYCVGDEMCTGSMVYECLKAGTEQSYCNYSASLDCTPCENGCADKQCVSASTSGNECEKIGLRANGKYCSSEYKLDSQKVDEALCENDFECSSNICKNEKCGEGGLSVLIYLIIAAVALFLIIIFIIVIVKKR